MDIKEKNAKNFDYMIRDGNEIVQYDIENKIIGMTFYDGKEVSRLLVFINSEGNIETGLFPKYELLNGELSSGYERIMDDYQKIMSTSDKIAMDNGCEDMSNTPEISYCYNGYYFYNTYLVYKKIKDKLISSNNDERFKPLIDNAHIQAIYEDEKFQHTIIKSFGQNKKIVEVSYYDYKLLFGWVNKNIYLLNIFGKDSSYPQDESVAIYKMSDDDNNSLKRFTLGDKLYFAVNTPKAFIKFNNYYKGKISELNRNSNSQFWDHFIKHLNGENVCARFINSQIGNLYIVYDYEKL